MSAPGEPSLERRRHRRLAADVPVEVQTAEKTIVGQLRDISQGGAAVAISDTPLAVDTSLNLTVGSKEGSFHLSLPGTVVVVRRSENQEKSYILHVKFSDLDIERLKLLAIFMNGLLTQPENRETAQAVQATHMPNNNFKKFFAGNDVDSFFGSLSLEDRQKSIANSSPTSSGSSVYRQHPNQSGPPTSPKIKNRSFFSPLFVLGNAVVMAVAAITVVMFLDRNKNEAPKPSDPTLAIQPDSQTPALAETSKTTRVDSSEGPSGDNRFIEFHVRVPITLEEIAEHVYFNMEQVGLLAAANPSIKSAREKILPSTLIRIPRFLEHLVQPGDSLAKLAEQYQESSSDYLTLFDDNRSVLADPKKLEPGMLLRVRLTLPWAEDWAAGKLEEEGSSTPE